MPHWPMDKVEEIEFKDMDKLMDFIQRKLITRKTNYGFRGQAKASWKLETTFVRFLGEIAENNAKYKNAESVMQNGLLKKLKRQFKENLIINDDIDQNHIENIDLWQFGQHFGLPSPLLDWTESPYVALFFCLNDKAVKDDSDKSLWVLNLDILHLLNDEVVKRVRPKYEKKLCKEMLGEQFPELEVIKSLDQKNKRKAFQQGFFTKLNFYSSIEVWLNRVVKELTRTGADEPIFRKLTFNCSEERRLDMLDRLDKMNINSRTLFPDIQGSVNHAIEATYRSLRNPSIKTFSFEQIKYDEKS